jgi:hypothetical protein
MSRAGNNIPRDCTGQQVGAVVFTISFEGVIATVIILKYPDFFTEDGVGLQRPGMIFPDCRDPNKIHLSLLEKINACASLDRQQPCNIRNNTPLTSCVPLRCM